MAKDKSKLDEGMDWLGDIKEEILGDDAPKSRRGKKGGRSRSKKSSHKRS